MRTHGEGLLRGPPSLKLVAYTDAVSLGGAEQTLAHLLAYLDPAVDVTVMAVDLEVAGALRQARPGASVRLVRQVAHKRDIVPILDHVRAVRSLRPDIFHASLRTTFSCQYRI